MNIIKNLIILSLVILFFSPFVIAYSISTPDGPIHQHITNESQFVWELIPDEIKDYLRNPIDETLDSKFLANFDDGDDIITGSGEEDQVASAASNINRNHFWDPDNPLGGRYDAGLYLRESAYVRARGLWKERVIPLYVRKKLPIGKDHQLQHRDIVEIVADR